MLQIYLCLTHWIECHHTMHMCVCLGSVGFHFTTIRTRWGLQTTTQWATLSPHLPKTYQLSGALGPQPLSIFSIDTNNQRTSAPLWRPFNNWLIWHVL